MHLKASAVLLLLLSLLVAGPASPIAHGNEAVIDIQLISIAGWNGEIEPSTVEGVAIGGAAELKSRWTNEQAANTNTLILGAGNAFGTSPPISNLFDDEPTIKSMNAMGFDADTLGNDNFDHGIAYLQRMLTMSDFPFLSANLTNVDQNLSGVKPYRIFDVAGVKVAVIGVTNPASPSVVFPGNFGTIEVTDPAFAAMRVRDEAASAGAEVFILITEMAVDSTSPAGGPLIDLARRLAGFDAVLGSSNSMNYSSTINGAQVVAPQQKGAYYSRTMLRFDPNVSRVVTSSAAFVQPVVTGEKSGMSVAMMVGSYRSQLNAKLAEVIATSAAVIGVTDLCGQVQGRSCESLTGDVLTDAARKTYGADFAIINSGGIRAGLTCPLVDNTADFCAPVNSAPYPITQGQVQAILPFGNMAATTTITGSELEAMLENGVSLVNDGAGRFPQVSGFCFWYDISRPVGSRVIAAVKQLADGSCSGAAVDFSAGVRYSLVTNDFIAAGGDGYAVLTGPVVIRDRLDTVLSDYLAAAEVVAPVAQGRINCLGAGCPALTSGVALPLPSGGSSAQIRPPSTGDAGLR